MSLKISKQRFADVISNSDLSSGQGETLWKALSECEKYSSPGKALQFLYYLGGLLVISAMTWFVTSGWSRLTGLNLFIIALAYGGVFLAGGILLWRRVGFQIPAGLLVTMAICMVPLAIFGLEKYTGIWPAGDPGDFAGYHYWVKGSWFLMEVGTIIAGCIALLFIRFPFLTAPIAFSLWYMSMDITPLLFGRFEFTGEQRLWVSFWFGLGMILSSYFVDKKTKKDFAFWGYLFGLLTFWGGLSGLTFAEEISWEVYGIVNLGLMIGSLILSRKTVMGFGGLGVFIYLAYLTHDRFANSIAFPFVLSAIGIGIVGLGIVSQKAGSLIKKLRLS